MYRSSSAYARESDDDSLLLLRHKGLIDRVTRRVAARCGGSVTAEELFSAAALGLLSAAQRFNPEREASFETFAEHRVRGAVLDELRNMDALPRRLRADAEKLKRSAAKLQQVLGREPTNEELCVDTGKTLDEVASLQLVSRPMEPLSEALESSVPSEAPDAEAEVLRKELATRLSSQVGRLPARTQWVLQMHYLEGLTYREIGTVLEVSEVRICQIHKEALRELKSRLTREDEG